MNVDTRQIGKLFLACVGVLVFAFFGSENVSGELQDYAGMDGRTYHAALHKKGKCKSCHGVKDAEGYPEDGTCLRCHEVEEIVTATQPDTEEDRRQNPHDNLHYGTDVPCVECHGEHSNKAPLCANCHNFDYSKHEY